MLAIRLPEEVEKRLDALARRTGSASAAYAAGLPMKDFEDGLQVAAATACGADVIATRNVCDYAESPVKADRPADVLRRIV